MFLSTNREKLLETVFLAFGSNLGDRRGTLSKARSVLGRTVGIEIVRSSRLYETKPVGGPLGQSPYLNSALELRTALSPEQLLALCQRIEARFGRERKERWGSRTLDLDILSFGERVSASAYLTLPHPRMHERAFVLIPLADIAGHWIHPLKMKSVAQLCTNFSDASGVRCLTEKW